MVTCCICVAAGTYFLLASDPVDPTAAILPPPTAVPTSPRVPFAPCALPSRSKLTPLRLIVKSLSDHVPPFVLQTPNGGPQRGRELAPQPNINISVKWLTAGSKTLRCTGCRRRRTEVSMRTVRRTPCPCCPVVALGAAAPRGCPSPTCC